MSTDIFDDLDALDRKLESIFPRKWMSLRAARDHLLFGMIEVRQRAKTRAEWDDVVRVLGGHEASTPIGSLVLLADRTVRSSLLRAFAQGLITTRGIEHSPDLQQAMREPVPLNWWKRTVDLHDRGANIDLSVHVISWNDSVIWRRTSSGGGEPQTLATLTDIEVDQPHLLKLAKPKARRDSAFGKTAPEMNVWLYGEMTSRKQRGEPHGRDAMVQALRAEFGPAITKADAIKMIESVPRVLRERRGRRAGNSGRQ